VNTIQTGYAKALPVVCLTVVSGKVKVNIRHCIMCKRLLVTCSRSVVFSWCAVFLQQ